MIVFFREARSFLTTKPTAQLRSLTWNSNSSSWESFEPKFAKIFHLSVSIISYEFIWEEYILLYPSFEVYDKRSQQAFLCRGAILLWTSYCIGSIISFAYLLIRLFLDVRKKLKLWKNSNKFSKKLKQIFQKLSNLPTPSWRSCVGNFYWSK